MISRLRSAALVLSFALLGACSDDVMTDAVPREPEGYPEALVSSGTAGLDQLVDNLAASYGDMSYAEYEKLLAADYVFRVDPAQVPVVGMEEFDAPGDLSSTGKMFDGEVGLDPVLDPLTGLPNGEFEDVPAVATISVNIDPIGSFWEEGRWGEYGLTWFRAYRVSMTVTYTGSSWVDQIYGMSVYYVEADPETGHWRMRAWEDQGVNSEIVARDSAGMSMASLKSRYLY